MARHKLRQHLRPAEGSSARRDALLFSAPGQPFSVRQRRPRLTAGARRAVGLALVGPSVALALSGFFAGAPPSDWLRCVYAAACLIWLCPVDRLFFRVERFRGMTPVRRGLSVVPALEANVDGGSTLRVDGEDAGAPSDARVYVRSGFVRSRFGWSSYYGLCLLCSRRVYELVGVGAEEDVRRYAAVLGRGLHGDSGARGR